MNRGAPHFPAVCGKASAHPRPSRLWAGGLGMAVVLLLAACGGDGAGPPDTADIDAVVPATDAPGEGAMAVPRWAQEAVWYQIFPERFRNGDPSNDPTAYDIRGSRPPIQPAGWAPTPWGHDWYAREDWAEATGEDFYATVQLRRYGGDLQGILDRLDDLRGLGVTALYLNPVNDAPSPHKYDARHYRHVDRNFGPDPRGDERIAQGEDPADPATWQWTAADSLFLELVREVHERDMRIIVDYSWNHTGITFWAWQDVLTNGADSPYADWYEIESFDDPATPAVDEFSYRGWAGVREMPELRKTGRPEGETHGAIEGDLVEPVKRHVYAVTRRWMDPDGDGDPTDGVDGFRLTGADRVPLGFWRDYRRFVRGINPEALLVGDVGWEDRPEARVDPAPWLQGDVFDAVMNGRWYEPTRGYFTAAPPELAPTEYMARLQAVESGIPEASVKARMNPTASHDSPRFSTSLYNPVRFAVDVSGRNPDYRVDAPGEETRRRQELILTQQFTWVGAPHVWYGDEVGMWGPDVPDSRKPMVWEDLAYEPEASHPLGLTREPDPVRPDLGLRSVYRELIAMRRTHLELFVDGEVRPWSPPGGRVTGQPGDPLVYERVLRGSAGSASAAGAEGQGGPGQAGPVRKQALVVLNPTGDPLTVTWTVAPSQGLGDFVQGFVTSNVGDLASVRQADGVLTVELPPLSAGVWIRE